MIASDTISLKTARGVAVVKVVQLPAMRAGKLLVSLVSTLGPSLGAAAIAAQTDKPDGFAGAIDALGSKLTPPEFERISNELLGPCSVSVAGQEAPLHPLVDDLFTGHVGELFKLLGFALKVNYSDFFAGALGDLSKLGAKFATKIKTTSGSSGQPNG